MAREDSIRPRARPAPMGSSDPQPKPFKICSWCNVPLEYEAGVTSRKGLVHKFCYDQIRADAMFDRNRKATAATQKRHQEEKKEEATGERERKKQEATDERKRKREAIRQANADRLEAIQKEITACQLCIEILAKLPDENADRVMQWLQSVLEAGRE